MIKDVIVEELREHRRAIESETNNDPKQYYAYLLRVQEQYKDRITTNPNAVPLVKNKVANS